MEKEGLKSPQLLMWKEGKRDRIEKKSNQPETLEGILQLEKAVEGQEIRA